MKRFDRRVKIKCLRNQVSSDKRCTEVKINFERKKEIISKINMRKLEEII